MAAKKQKMKTNGKSLKDVWKATVQHWPQTKQGKPREGCEARRLFKQKAPVKIPAPEVEKKADALAKVIQDRELVLEEKRAVNAELREKLNYFDERLMELAESVRSHSEVKDVSCVEFYVERTGEIIVVRQDTGEQIGQPRAATAEERQEGLPGFDDDNDTIPASALETQAEGSEDAQAGGE